MNLYGGYLPHFEIIGNDFPEKCQIFGEIFVSSNDQLGKGHINQLIVFMH